MFSEHGIKHSDFCYFQVIASLLLCVLITMWVHRGIVLHDQHVSYWRASFVGRMTESATMVSFDSHDRSVHKIFILNAHGTKFDPSVVTPIVKDRVKGRAGIFS